MRIEDAKPGTPIINGPTKDKGWIAEDGDKKTSNGEVWVKYITYNHHGRRIEWWCPIEDLQLRN